MPRHTAAASALAALAVFVAGVIPAPARPTRPQAHGESRREPALWGAAAHPCLGGRRRGDGGPAAARGVLLPAVLRGGAAGAKRPGPAVPGPKKKRGGGGGGFFMQRPPPPRHGEKEIPEGAPACLEGMQFVVTGVLESLDRDEAVQLCERHGARVVGAVSGKVTHALVGQDAGPGKLAKLQAMPHIKILSEDDLLDIIRSSAPAASAATPDASGHSPVGGVPGSGLAGGTQGSRDQSRAGAPVGCEGQGGAQAQARAGGEVGEGVGTQGGGGGEMEVAVSPPMTTGGVAASSGGEGGAADGRGLDTQQGVPGGFHVDELWVEKYRPTKLSEIAGHKTQVYVILL